MFVDSDLFDLYVFAEMGTIIQTEYLCISVLGVTARPRLKLVECKEKCFKSPGGLYYLLFKGGGPGDALTLCSFVSYSTRRFYGVLYLDKHKKCL